MKVESLTCKEEKKLLENTNYQDTSTDGNSMAGCYQVDTPSDEEMVPDDEKMLIDEEVTSSKTSNSQYFNFFSFSRVFFLI